MGMKFVSLAPKELWPNDELVNEMQEVAKVTKGSIHLTEDIDDVEGADVIYTDVWVSMGEEEQYEQRINLLKDYQVNMDMINKTKNENVIFLHCLPSFHDLETVVAREIYEKYSF